jgi:hypothetical protein
MRRALECGGLTPLSAGDLSPSNVKRATEFIHGPLDAALLWRQVAKAAKAVTGHRTPKLREQRVIRHEIEGFRFRMLTANHLQFLPAAHSTAFRSS